MEEKERQTSFREMCIREQTPVSLLRDKEEEKSYFIHLEMRKKKKIEDDIYVVVVCVGKSDEVNSCISCCCGTAHEVV